MAEPRLRLAALPGDFAVTQLPAGSAPPPWAMAGSFWNVSGTAEEVSVVCETAQVPPGTTSETGWALLKLQGPFAFELTGILAAVANPLRDAGVGIFAVSTFDTDYVLVKHAQLDDARAALRSAGHVVDG